MNLGIFTHSVPGPHVNGGPMTVWAIAKEFSKKSIKSEVIVLLQSNKKKFRNKRVTIKNFPRITIFRPTKKRKPYLLKNPLSLLDFSEKIKDQFNVQAIEKFVANKNFDALLLYHWEPISVLAKWRTIPKLGIVGDPWHHPRVRNWDGIKKQMPITRQLFETLKHFLRSFFDMKTMITLLNSCDSSGSFQKHEAEIFKKNGAKNCKYYRTPLIEVKKSRHIKKHNNTKIILLGPSNLEATSTRHGLTYFANEIYPELIKRYKKFRIRIVGEGKPPDEILKIASDKRIELTGRIDPPDKEFENCTIQLVPTPFVLGIRVRILTGFNYGACVVAHKNESVNIPELQDGKNCLLASSGKEFALQIKKVFSSNKLKEKISRQAKIDFNKYFNSKIAVKKIEKNLLEIINTKKFLLKSSTPIKLKNNFKI